MLTEEQQQLVIKNLSFARKIANYHIRKLNIQPHHWDDIVQECFLGLCHVIRKFDPSRKIHFATYAKPVIEGYMRRGMKKLFWGIEGSENHKTVIRTVKRIPLEDIKEVDILEIDFDELDKSTKIYLVQNAINNHPLLSKTERVVLDIMFHNDTTFEEISKSLKISRQAVQQAYVRGLEKLKKHFSPNGVKKIF